MPPAGQGKAGQGRGLTRCPWWCRCPAAELLAATALAVFPNTATRGPSGSRSAAPATVRDAMEFIDDNAHRDVTPLAYLRATRLRRAHRDLLDADPETDTSPRSLLTGDSSTPSASPTTTRPSTRCRPTPPHITLHT